MNRKLPKILCLLLAVVGCEGDTAAPPAAPAARMDVPLKVVVVDQPEVAKTIHRLRGDWAVLTGGSLSVEECSTATLKEETRNSQPLEADILVFPSRYLAALVEHQQVQPLRNSVRDDKDVAFSQILPVIREAGLSYGGDYYAVPFVTQLLAIAAADPGTHTTVSEATFPSHASSRTGRIEAIPTALPESLPEGPFAAAWALLAQAAPMACHPTQAAILFDLETMQPRINSPLFLRALEDLVDAAAGPQRNPPQSQLKWVWWPPLSSAARDGSPPQDRVEAVWLPQSSDVYDASANEWESPADDFARAPLVGASSSIGSVAASSRNSPAAFRLLAWFASRSSDGGGRASVAPYRTQNSGELLREALSRSRFLRAPRILEVDDYLAALDQAVQRARQGELTPEQALQDAANKWEETTNRLGRERQREVYRKHLNIQ